MIRTHDIYKPLYTDTTHPIILITGGRGSGKCLKKGTQVIMADLTLRNVEDVRVGECLMGTDGTPRTVLETTHGYGDLYKVRQTSGEDYITNEAHILTLKKSKAAMNDKGNLTKNGTYRRPNGRYPNYEEVADIPVTAYAASSKHFRENFRGFKVGQIEYAASEVEIPPYLLGVWLGDGTAMYPSVTTPEAEIINYMSAYGEDNGLRFVSGSKKGKAQTFFLRGDGSIGGNTFTNALKHYNLVSNKHIPQCYISNSARNRLELLAGLLDTDGHASCGGYEITQSRYEMARQIKFLADTLGFRTSINHHKAKCGGKWFDSWRVHIGGDCWRIPCKVRHKEIHREECHKNKDWHLSYISISKEAEQGEWYGFLTDGDHRFLLGDGTVTHNSFCTGAFIERLTFEKKPQEDGASLAHQILYTRYTMVSAAISIIPEFLEKIELDGTERYFTHTRTDVQNLMTGSHIMFRGIKTSSGVQTAKLKSIHGITTFVVDEAEEWTSEKDFETIFYSIRQKGIQNRVIIIMNPTDSYHWVYQRFIKNTHRIVDYDGFPVQISTHPQVLHIHTSYLDNIQNLSEEFIKSARLTKEREPSKYAHLFMGQWADVAEGAVFKHVGEVKDFPDYADKLAVGLDFGFAADPSAAVLCGVYDDQLFMKELFYKHGMKAKDIAETLAPLGLPVYADSADPRLIDDIQLQGVNIYPVHKYAGSILAGIDKMQSMQLFVTSDSHNMLNEFHNYVWDKDKDGNYINRPVDRDNHCFTADTRVATPYGDVRITSLKEGDEVYTSEGKRKVSKFFDNGERGIIEVRITFSDTEVTLKATPDHKIKTSDGWKRLDQLKCGDVLFLLNGKDTVRNVETIRRSTSHVYDIEVEGVHEFFANGILVHNCVDATRYYVLTRLLGHLGH